MHGTGAGSSRPSRTFFVLEALFGTEYLSRSSSQDYF
jgi:hypothetical protein